MKNLEIYLKNTSLYIIPKRRPPSITKINTKIAAKNPVSYEQVISSSNGTSTT